MTRLEKALAEIELAWRENRAPETVDRLAAAHPEHAAELYDFLASLVDSADAEALPAAYEMHTADRAQSLLETWPARPRRVSFARFLQQRTGEEPAQIAARVGDVSWEFLVLVGRHPEVVPEPVRDEIAVRLERVFDLSPEETRQRLADPRPTLRAASRRGDYPPPPASFEELLRRSALDRRQREIWRRWARK